MTRRKASKLLIGAASVVALPPALATSAWAQASAERIAELAKPGPNGDRVLGQHDAPVTIIEYASMTCPFCASFHANVLPAIKKNYVDTGKAKLIYRDFPLDDLALVVALLAHCVKGDAYFEFLNVLYKQQRAWAAAPKAQLMKLAKQVGITEDGFDKCIANQEVLDGIRWERDRASNDFEIRSTPTLFVNGKRMRPGASAEEFGVAIDEAIAAAM
ncbi:Periplasmic thiol:disulfide interchange protein DsbA [hydrothermal vent metagenome]|uniref:Periplasmic thiol:disulfide interchange protein DsbA n=1 Tax=hydrothermal vent metagenome TaxID=652676 RepID=A0A3B0T6E2_9ZZZZ